MSDPAPITRIIDTPEWRTLQAHHDAIEDVHLRQLFADDPNRGETLTAEAGDIYLDYSKNRLTAETIDLLVALARAADVETLRDRMFAGEKINITEDRAVLHIALRAPSSSHIYVDGVDVVPQVHRVLAKMKQFSDRVRGGQWRGHNGKQIRNVVNIGIGGSDLGPHMAHDALVDFSDRAMTFRFVSNVDGIDFYECTRDLDQ